MTAAGLDRRPEAATPAASSPVRDAASALARREARAMGSPLRLLLAGAVPDDLVDALWTDVTDEFEAAEEAMSPWRASSGISALCRAAPEALPCVSPRLRRALVAADRAVRVTGGRFDPRIVADLARLGFGAPRQHHGTPPGEAGGGGAGARRSGTGGTARAGARLLVRSGRTGSIALPEPVDLGGIGKGLALRWAARRVAAHLTHDRETPVSGYLIDAGGDVVAEGWAGDTGPWSIGIEDPLGRTVPVAVVEIHGSGAITTSSTRIHRRESEDGEIVHHLIDPRTGEPGGGGLAAVTVAGPDPAWAEVWSKALFVEGRRGIAALARRRGLAAWWIDRDGVLEMTPAARAMTSWVAAEA